MMVWNKSDRGVFLRLDLYKWKLNEIKGNRIFQKKVYLE